MTLVLLIPSSTKSEGCLVLFTILNPLNKTKSTSKPEPRLELLKEKKKEKTTQKLKERWKEKTNFKRTLLGLSRRRNYSQKIQEKEVSKKEGHQSDDCTTKRKKSLL